MQRSNTTSNQIPTKSNHQGKPRFIYDLPKDFPFNEALVEKSFFSNEMGNSGVKSGSQGNNTNS